MSRLTSHQTDIEFFDNSSNALGRIIASELRKTKKLMIAVAYATIPNSHEVIQILKKLAIKKDKQAQIIVGLGYENTKPDSLETLLSLQHKSKGRLCCRVYGDERFHPKLYIFDKVNGRRTMIVGSSNLTPEGLTTNIEANLLLRGNSDDPVFAAGTRYFAENLWRSTLSRKLSRSVIDAYKRDFDLRQDLTRSLRNRTCSRKLKKSLDNMHAEEVSAWKGFDREFADFLRNVCSEAEHKMQLNQEYAGFRDLWHHTLMVGFFETLISEMAKLGFLYIPRQRGHYPEEELVCEITPGNTPYFQRCFSRDNWQDCCRLFVYFIYVSGKTRMRHGSLQITVCLDFIRKKGVSKLEYMVSRPELLEETMKKCEENSIEEFALYSSDQCSLDRKIAELNRVRTFIGKSTKWNRVSLESFLSRDFLSDKRLFRKSELIGDAVAQARKFADFAKFILNSASGTRTDVLINSSPTTSRWLSIIRFNVEKKLESVGYMETKTWAYFRNHKTNRNVAYLHPCKNQIRLFTRLLPSFDSQLEPTPSSKKWGQMYPSMFRMKSENSIEKATSLIVSSYQIDMRKHSKKGG